MPRHNSSCRFAFATDKQRPESALCLGQHEASTMSVISVIPRTCRFHQCKSIRRKSMDTMILGKHPLLTPNRFP